MPLVSSIRPFYSLQQIQSVNTHIYLLYMLITEISIFVFSIVVVVVEVRLKD